MFNESELISVIATQTGYPVYLADELVIKQVALTGVQNPIVYVGHVGVELFNKTEMLSDGYSEIDSPQYLLTSVHFVCDRNNFKTVRTNVYNAVRTFEPYLNDPCYTKLSFIKGKVIAATSNCLWYQDIFGLQFPRIT